MLSSMNTDNICIRSIILYEYKKGTTARKCSLNINEAFQKELVTPRTCQRWYSKFRSGDYDLQNLPGRGRQFVVEDEVLEQVLESNPRQSCRDIAEKLNIHHSTVSRRLNKLNYISKLDVLVPHTMTEKHRQERVSICTSLLCRQNCNPFLHRVITGDEKWVLYNNFCRKRHWGKAGESPLVSSKPSTHPEKVLLCCWWDFKGVVYYELLPPNTTVTSELYCSQLDRLDAALHEKRSQYNGDVILLHDNAKPHTAFNTQKKLRQLGWEVLNHPPYSPDLAPSDYYLFRSLSNYLRGKKFSNIDEVKVHLEEFFYSKPSKFYATGLLNLADRWDKVIQSNGGYLTD